MFGGENEVFRRLEEKCKEKGYMVIFFKLKIFFFCDVIEFLMILLLFFLKFGCLLICKLWYDLIDVIKEYKGGNKIILFENMEG